MKNQRVKHILSTVIIGFIAYLPLNGFCQAPTIRYSTPQIYTVGVTIPTLTPTVGGTAAANGLTSTFAGSGAAGSNDGLGIAASFNQPLGTAVDAAGNIYVADAGTHIIRKITPAGNVSTLAGSAYSTGFTDGLGSAARFNHPVGLAVDAAGNVYVADEVNNAIRKISPAGQVLTIAGTGIAGYNNGPVATATFNLPCGVAVDALGNVYVADYNNNQIREISTAGMVSIFAGLPKIVR